MPTISIGIDEYLIDTGRVLAQIDGPNVVSGALAIRNVLRGCVGEYYAMQQLRNLVMDLHCADRVNAQDDVAVAELIATLVWSGRLHLIDLTPAPTSVRKFLTWDSTRTAFAAEASATAARAVRRSSTVVYPCT